MCGAETDGATDGGAGQGAAKPHTIVIAHCRLSLLGRPQPVKYLSTRSMVSHLVQQANESLFGVCSARDMIHGRIILLPHHPCKRMMDQHVPAYIQTHKVEKDTILILSSSKYAVQLCYHLDYRPSNVSKGMM